MIYQKETLETPDVIVAAFTSHFRGVFRLGEKICEKHKHLMYKFTDWGHGS